MLSYSDNKVKLTRNINSIYDIAIHKNYSIDYKNSTCIFFNNDIKLKKYYNDNEGLSYNYLYVLHIIKII